MKKEWPAALTIDVRVSHFRPLADHAGMAVSTPWPNSRADDAAIGPDASRKTRRILFGNRGEGAGVLLRQPETLVLV